MSFSNTFAANTGYYISSAEAAKIQKEVSKVGIRLLNSNGLKNRTVFFFDANSSRKAYSIHRDRQIIIYRGLYVLLDDEDQLAAVLGHEISHSMDSYDGIFRGFFHNLNNLCTPRKYEYKSDKRAVDYMVNAGYNPVALIVVMSKVFPQTRYEWCCTHPLTSRRMMEVYEYIYKKYPEFHLTKEGAKFDKNMTSNLLKLGIPLGFQWSILFIGSFVQSRQVNLFGDGLATKAVTCYSPFEGYITIPLSVMSSALLSFVGQNYGAGYFDRIKKGIKECILIDIIFYIFILLITIPLIKYVPYIFLPATDLEGQAGELIKFYSNTYLYIVTPSLILQGLLQLSRSSLQGIKKPMIPFLSGVGELVARILVCLFIPSLINPSNPFSNESYVGICFSTPSAWLVSVLIMGLSSIYIIFIKGLENSKHISLKNSNQ